MREQLSSLLMQARTDLRALRSRVEGSPADPLLTDVFQDLYKIGLAIARDPALAASPELRAYLDETAPELEKDHVALLFYPNNLVNEFQRVWEDDEWKQLCRRRSALQFFLDLYRGTTLQPFVEEIETDLLDENMREWGTREGFLTSSEIDPQIPRSHWWWWLPEAPL